MFQEAADFVVSPLHTQGHQWPDPITAPYSYQTAVLRTLHTPTRSRDSSRPSDRPERLNFARGKRLASHSFQGANESVVLPHGPGVHDGYPSHSAVPAAITEPCWRPAAPAGWLKNGVAWTLDLRRSHPLDLPSRLRPLTAGARLGLRHLRCLQKSHLILQTTTRQSSKLQGRLLWA
jgi:hypothetical protein